MLLCFFMVPLTLCFLTFSVFWYKFMGSYVQLQILIHFSFWVRTYRVKLRRWTKSIYVARSMKPARITLYRDELYQNYLRTKCLISYVQISLVTWLNMSCIGQSCCKLVMFIFDSSYPYGGGNAGFVEEMPKLWGVKNKETILHGAEVEEN